MWSMDYVDEYTVESCRKQFLRVYPEFRPYFIGCSQDKQALIAEVYFPDGTFYFRVTERSVSAAYKNKEDADRY